MRLTVTVSQFPITRNSASYQRQLVFRNILPIITQISDKLWLFPVSRFFLFGTALQENLKITNVNLASAIYLLRISSTMGRGIQLIPTVIFATTFLLLDNWIKPLLVLRKLAFRICYELLYSFAEMFPRFVFKLMPTNKKWQSVFVLDHFRTFIYG